MLQDFSLTSPVLSVVNLSSYLKIKQEVLTVVHNLSFELYAGRTLAIVGESGCGKSLTALSILRILPAQALPSTGSIFYKGQDLLKIKEWEMRSLRGSKIAMIFQDPMSALNPVYTIGNQLMEVAEIHLGIFEEEAWSKACEMLSAVGILNAEERMHAYPHELSGGLKQRVMIAMALMCEPDILIADEPTTALDVTIQKQILDLLKQLQKKNRMAILLITHDLGIVSEMADEAIVMYMAEEVERGSVDDILIHTSHPYTKGLLHSRPSLKERREKLLPIKGQVPSFKNIPTGCRFHTRCPHVMEKCTQGEVGYFAVHLPSHFSKCWLSANGSETK